MFKSEEGRAEDADGGNTIIRSDEVQITRILPAGLFTLHLSGLGYDSPVWNRRVAPVKQAFESEADSVPPKMEFQKMLNWCPSILLAVSWINFFCFFMSNGRLQWQNLRVFQKTGPDSIKTGPDSVDPAPTNQLRRMQQCQYAAIVV